MIVIKTFAGDYAPDLTFTITREDGSIVNLTGATVWFIIQDPDTGLITNEPNGSITNQCALINSSAGTCQYVWNKGGTDCPDPGVYMANIKIKYASGEIETYQAKISAAKPIAFIS